MLFRPFSATFMVILIIFCETVLPVYAKNDEDTAVGAELETKMSHPVARLRRLLAVETLLRVEKGVILALCKTLVAGSTGYYFQLPFHTNRRLRHVCSIVITSYWSRQLQLVRNINGLREWISSACFIYNADFCDLEKQHKVVSRQEILEETQLILGDGL